MEVEPQPAQYSLRFSDNRTVSINGDILREFGTLQDMVEDFPFDLPVNGAGQIEIPILEVEGLTADRIQSVVDFYVSGENAYLGASENVLVDMIRLTDYLQANRMLVALVDLLHQGLEQLSLAELEKRYMAIGRVHAMLGVNYLSLAAVKRKATKEESEAEGIPIRPQYRRAWLISKIMASLIASDLVRGVDQRIEKYVHLLAASSALTAIRYGIEDSDVLLYSYKTGFIRSQLKGSTISLERGRNLLYSGEISEFVLGDFFLATLTRESGIGVYGEYYGARDESLLTIEEYHLQEGEEALGIWSGKNFVVSLTNKALIVDGYLFHKPQAGKYIRVATNTEWLRTILSVSAGDGHVLIHTTQGVYGMGVNSLNALGSNYPDETSETVALLDTGLDSNEIAKIFASGYYSIILTKAGELHHSGISLLGGLEPKDAWPRIALPESVRKAGKISLISGDPYKLVILAGNTLFTLRTRQMSEQPEFEQEADLPDTIIDAIILRGDDSMLVATPTALYLYTRIRDNTFLAELGGSESTKSPYKLKVPFNIQSSVASATNESKKKPRMDCQYCFASALFRDQTRDNLLCSRYCQYKGLSSTLLK